MCGRFAQALSARDYFSTVDIQLHEPQEQRSGGSALDKSDNHPDTQRQLEKSLTLQNSVADDDYHPTHNVAPGVQVPIVRLERPNPFDGYTVAGRPAIDTAENDIYHGNSPRSLLVQSMRWGLLPHYTTGIPRGPDAMKTINARDDAVLSGRSMWTPLLRGGKRCVVFCQGFYEWLKKEDGAQRIAHFVGMKDEGFGRTDVEGTKRALMPMAGLYEKCNIDGNDVYSFTIITTDSNKQLGFLVSMPHAYLQ